MGEMENSDVITWSTLLLRSVLVIENVIQISMWNIFYTALILNFLNKTCIRALISRKYLKYDIDTSVRFSKRHCKFFTTIISANETRHIFFGITFQLFTNHNTIYFRIFFFLASAIHKHNIRNVFWLYLWWYLRKVAGIKNNSCIKNKFTGIKYT